MKLKKLDIRGFTHDILMVAFVVVFAVAGVGYIVASHADSCPPASGPPASSADSGPASGQDCPASGPASQPASKPAPAPSKPAVYVSGNCTINGVPPNPAYGQQIAPSVTLRNTGNQAFTVNGFVNMQTNGDNNSQSNKGGPLTAESLAAGQTVTRDTGLRYTTDYSTSSARYIVFSANNSNPDFNCSATLKLPTAPSKPQPAPARTPTGTLDIVTYQGSIKDSTRIGSVYVVTDQGGSKVQCSPSKGTTNSTKGSNYGHLRFKCPAASNGGPRTYKFVSATRNNYKLGKKNPHKPGSTFKISAGKTTTFTIVMERK